ncbi:hypothetical protein KC328_g58 [Hortaea werneckii]|nr:hypothetical protein KC328_g58 [Hortaea werneckii]
MTALEKDIDPAELKSNKKKHFKGNKRAAKKVRTVALGESSDSPLRFRTDVIPFVVSSEVPSMFSPRHLDQLDPFTTCGALPSRGQSSEERASSRSAHCRMVVNRFLVQGTIGDGMDSRSLLL